MNVPFVKMHGIGNDFVMVDATGKDGPAVAELLRKHAVKLCDRHFGIGADGVVAVLSCDDADYRMRMYNPDGSEAEMCGNALRCLPKLVFDRGLTSKTELSVMTGAGLLRTRANLINGFVDTVKVDMGEAHLDRSMIPVDFGDGADGTVIGAPLEIGPAVYSITCVSMGNPHCVVFIDGPVSKFPVTSIGPLFELAAPFPHRTNTEFVELVAPGEINMRVWERGAGETLACGTGACASAVASCLNGHTGRKVLVHLAGGDLAIDWRDDNHVFMTGSATTVFEGTVALD